MTALEQAKRFIKQNAAKTALVIVPLAIATSASASPLTFDVPPQTADAAGSALVTPTAGSGSFTSADGRAIKFSTIDDYVFDVAAPSCSSGSCFAPASLSLTLTGQGSGTLDPLSIPAHYDYIFNLGQGNPFQNFSSEIDFFINGDLVATSGPLSDGDGVTFTELSAPDFALSGYAPTTLSNWSVILSANFDTSGIGQIGLHIPFNSIDITPAAEQPNAAVPEPASLFLLASGASILVARRRRWRRPTTR